MSFVFLHTADWQIGKAFGGMPKEVAIALSEARISTIDRMADAASTAGARHVLAAGDVFDAESLAPKTVRRALVRMGRHSELIWHLLPGNHDAHRPGGLWERLADDLPANVRPHLSPGPIEMERSVWLLPAPLTGRAAATDPTAYFDAAQTPAGDLRIGLAHGSVQGFGSDGEASINIAPERAASAQLDYLALGDWHGAKKINARTWYSGTPEPDRFLSNEPGHALLVQIDAPGRMPVVEKLRTAQFTWIDHEIEIRQAVDVAPFEKAVAETGGRPSDVLARLVLSGRVTASSRQDIGRKLKMLDASLRHLDVDLSKLVVSADHTDLESLGAAGDLRQVGDALARLCASARGDDAALGTFALSMLLDLASEAGA